MTMIRMLYVEDLLNKTRPPDLITSSGDAAANPLTARMSADASALSAKTADSAAEVLNLTYHIPITIAIFI